MGDTPGNTPGTPLADRLEDTLEDSPGDNPGDSGGDTSRTVDASTVLRSARNAVRKSEVLDGLHCVQFVGLPNAKSAFLQCLVQVSYNCVVGSHRGSGEAVYLESPGISPRGNRLPSGNPRDFILRS